MWRATTRHDNGCLLLIRGVSSDSDLSLFNKVSSERVAGLGWFLAWALTAILLAVGVFGAFGVGILVLPVGAASALLLTVRAHRWPDSLGILAGLGLLAVSVSFLNRHFNRCPLEPPTVTRQPGFRAPQCGGLNPFPWLIVGILLLVIAIASYSVLRMSRPDNPGGSEL